MYDCDDGDDHEDNYGVGVSDDDNDDGDGDDQFPLPHSRGSSHGQSRGIRRAYPDPGFVIIVISIIVITNLVLHLCRFLLIRLFLSLWSS